MTGRSDHPAGLWLVRHGESAGNVARDRAEADGSEVIDIAVRDMDVQLSALGREQAATVGLHLAGFDDDQRPTAVLCSPYTRAHQTAEIIIEAAGLARLGPPRTDERLREREFGVLDRLTRRGIVERFPDQAAARAFLGKFYHRPPGGESWCDVALRVRSVLDAIDRTHPDQRVLVVTHQVVILMFRYVLESLSEAEILSIDRGAEVANCSLTTYRNADDGRGLVLDAFNVVEHITEQGVAATAEPNVAGTT